MTAARCRGCRNRVDAQLIGDALQSLDINIVHEWSKLYSRTSKRKVESGRRDCARSAQVSRSYPTSLTRLTRPTALMLRVCLCNQDMRSSPRIPGPNV